MLKNITLALSLSLLLSPSLYADESSSNEVFKPELITKLLNKYGSGFASLEHKNMGDLVRLHFITDNPTDTLSILTLPNGIKLSYGEIVMYAGDMFGDPTKAISSCAIKDQMNCFKLQFAAMAIDGSPSDTKCKNPLNQAKAIKNYMFEVQKELELSRQNGNSDWIYYSAHDVELSGKMNKLTCGGSIVSNLFPFGNYIKLAETNFDHFAPDSLVAYQVGHRYALETAQKGFEKRKLGLDQEANKLLELAYAQNAYANHYLTDSFSSGHMRTPRRAIDKDISLPAVLNLLIANLMHNEDNRNGLNVVNHEGSSWLAYGDGYLNKPEAQLQKTIMLDAMQRSADGIYATFISGKIPDIYPEMNLFPDYEKIQQLNQTAPLFKVENGVLLKRISNDDPLNYRWTKYWSGLVTLIQFKAGY